MCTGEPRCRWVTPCPSPSITCPTRSADRTVAAYGVNGGVEQLGHATFRTTDVAVYDQPRPIYWDDRSAIVRTSASRRSRATPPRLHDPRRRMRAVGRGHWAADVPRLGRCRRLTTACAPRPTTKPPSSSRSWLGSGRAEPPGDEPDLLRSFTLATGHSLPSPLVRHTDWRAFQLGFLLANVGPSSTIRDGERRIVDTLWFATGVARPRRTSGTSSRRRSTTACGQSARASRRGAVSPPHAVPPADTAVRGRVGRRRARTPRRAHRWSRVPLGFFWEAGDPEQDQTEARFRRSG